MEPESQKRKLDETSHESQNTPILCVNNCGFYGNANTNNLCSKCYKDYLLKQSMNPIEEEKKTNKVSIDQIESNTPQAVVQETNNNNNNDDNIIDNNRNDAEEGASSENPEKRPANRCSFCRKRIGLTGFKCRCEQTFCSLHRYSDKHNCVFDYKSAAQDAIAKANPVVKADKVEKI